MTRPDLPDASVIDWLKSHARAHDARRCLGENMFAIAAERLAAAPTPSELATLAAIRAGTWKAVPVDLLRQVYGMANRGSDSPPAAYRWCERINEVMHAGPLPEFAEYAEDVPLPRGEGDA